MQITKIVREEADEKAWESLIIQSLSFVERLIAGIYSLPWKFKCWIKSLILYTATWKFNATEDTYRQI